MSTFALLPLLLPLVQEGSQDPLIAELDATPRVTPVVRVVQAVTPAVVFIETEATQERLDLWGRITNRTFTGSGSGVVIEGSGYVVTNYHVVQGAERIWVSFDQIPERYAAELVSFVAGEDLALLHIQGQQDETFPIVRMGTSADLMPGESVVAIGNPYGQTHTVSTGIISGLHRGVSIPEQGLEFEDLIQTDASINFGNSGGPLLNIRGELIGINTAMNRQAENIGFAIPVDRVRDVLTELLFPMARKSWLGFDLAPGDELVVRRVWTGSPAAQAGICEGDRVLVLGDTAVANADEYLHASLVLEPAQEVEVVLARGDGRERVTLEAWDRLDGLTFERFGATLREVRFGRRGTGVLVDRLREGGPAQRLGLQPLDWLSALKVPGTPLAYSPQDRSAMARLLDPLPAGTRLQIDVYRDEDGDQSYTRGELYKGTVTLD